MKKFPARFWIVVFLLGFLFDYLFWKHTPGISFAIYAVASLAIGFILLWVDGIRPDRRSLVLVPFILFFAVMTFLRAESLTVFLAHAMTLFLMAGLVVTYRGGLWMQYSLADYFSRAFDLLGSVIARPLLFTAEVQRIKREAGEAEKRPNPVWPVLRGLLFALPVLAFFTSLLSSADVVFAERVRILGELFRLENLPEYIFRLIYISVMAYALAGIFLHAADRSSDEKLMGVEKPIVPRFLGFTEGAMVLGSVVLLFLSFVIIQFGYFFGGNANITIEGYTYAEYARRGFGELVTVAFFALLLFLGLSSVVRREADFQQKLFSGLGLALVALVGVMLVSAFQRLVLYETAYGFTRLRTYTHVFILWLGLLLAAVVALELLQKQRIFAFAALLAAVGFVLSLNVLSVDGFIVRQNVERYRKGEGLDVGYLASLSSDAVPVIARLYNAPASDQPTRERLAAALACYQQLNPVDGRDTSWQAFHLGQYLADQSLRSMQAVFKDYPIVQSDRDLTVETPSGETFDCYSYVYD